MAAWQKNAMNNIIENITPRVISANSTLLIANPLVVYLLLLYKYKILNVKDFGGKFFSMLTLALVRFICVVCHVSKNYSVWG